MPNAIADIASVDALAVLLSWLTARAAVIARVLLIVALALVVYQVLSRLLQRQVVDMIFEQGRGRGARLESKARTAVRIVHDVTKYAILVIAGYMILLEFGLDLTIILASISIIGLAVSFGAQSVVKDVVTGLSLFVEDQLNVGDFVEIVGVAGAVGVVEDFGLRATRLRDIHGDLHFIPNGQIGAINHYSRGFVTFQVDVALPADVGDAEHAATMDDVREVARRLAAEVPLFVGEPAIVDLDAADRLVRLVVQIVPGAGWVVEKELVGRIKAALGRRFPETSLAEPVTYRVSPELLAYRERLTVLAKAPR